MKRIFAFFLFAVCLIALSVPAFAETADKTELTALLNENYDPSLYTMESYQTYQFAINHALTIYEDDASPQEEVDTVTAELKDAKNGLELVLNREPLLTYVDNIDEFLYGTNYVLSEDTIEALTAARKEFLELYQSETLTKEQLSAASQKFINVIEAAEGADEVKKFSSKDPGEGVIVPTKVISSSQGLGRVTAIRLILLGIGTGLIIVGAIATILYLKPPKFLK